MTTPPSVAAQKQALRTAYAEHRNRRTPELRRTAAWQLRTRVKECHARSVAAFIPTNGEPGSLAVLDELAQRAQVIVPVTGRVGEPLRWAAYRGPDSLVDGPFGLRQPAASDRSTLADVEMIAVPAVAIGLDGSRLGHGGGFYDRALHGIDAARLVGVVYDDEVALRLPVEQHDVRIGWLCTPTRLIRLE